MGSTDDATSTVSDRAADAVETAQKTPQKAKQKTQGNPLAAGLIALGAGWLVASLLPAAEQ